MRTLKAEWRRVTRAARVYFSRVSRGTSSVSPFCAEGLRSAEILLLCHWSILDQNVNARSLGSFIGAPPTRQAEPQGLRAHASDCGRLRINSIPNSPRSNI